MSTKSSEEKILSIDIGGTRIKATILDINGNMLMDYERTPTPSPANPENILQTISTLIKGFDSYTRVSVGFPGYVRKGIVYTADNLANEAWRKVDLSKRLGDLLKRPVRVLNDADMQGLGIAKGEGLEMVVTLGTGFGTALLLDGKLLPHLEFAHNPIKTDKDYDQYIGKKALEEVGLEKWNSRMRKVIAILKVVFNYDHLYIGGGNSKKLNINLDDNITLVSNIDGIKGGAKLWQNDYYNV